MIQLTRLNHQPITLNAELIQWVESSPDTVITLVNGEKLVVLESRQEVSSAFLRYQRRKRRIASGAGSRFVASRPRSAE